MYVILEGEPWLPNRHMLDTTCIVDGLELFGVQQGGEGCVFGLCLLIQTARRRKCHQY